VRRTPDPHAIEPDRDAFTSIRARLQRGARVSDRAFDAVYPPPLRKLSSTFWTPVAVAQRAVTLLVRDAGAHARVLDVGSGAGKLCLIGSIATGASFVGLERREHLVRAAERAAERLGAETCRFAHAQFETADVASFDAIYLFNPFEENLWRPSDRIDTTVELSVERYPQEVARAEVMLARARAGTRVVTYHGFGAPMPDDYALEHREPHRSGGCLELWVKASPRGREPAREPGRAPEPSREPEREREPR
jgi:SAM-dependent methyltransferase